MRLVQALWALLFPRGRHRAARPAPSPPRSAPRTPHRFEAPLNGDAARLVRPYLVAHEQRVRRHELALAALGMDGPGPYVIHGVEVP